MNNSIVTYILSLDFFEFYTQFYLSLYCIQGLSVDIFGNLAVTLTKHISYSAIVIKGALSARTRFAYA